MLSKRLQKRATYMRKVLLEQGKTEEEITATINRSLDFIRERDQTRRARHDIEKATAAPQPKPKPQPVQAAPAPPKPAEPKPVAPKPAESSHIIIRRLPDTRPVDEYKYSRDRGEFEFRPKPRKHQPRPTQAQLKIEELRKEYPTATPQRQQAIANELTEWEDFVNLRHQG